mmetsp:Transcript_53677/g.142736  ORF Transcript_53677/g.142736 Transcript_53677/m.142736 type:complete len:304 (-) Transcript_53677:100-1011(-)
MSHPNWHSLPGTLHANWVFHASPVPGTCPSYRSKHVCSLHPGCPSASPCFSLAIHSKLTTYPEYPSSSSLGIPLLLQPGLLLRNQKDHHPEHGLGGHIRRRVPHLLVHHRLRPPRPQALHDVHRRILHPGHHREVPGNRHQPHHAARLPRGGPAQGAHEHDDHEEEGDHGAGEPEKSRAVLGLLVARVAEGDHQHAGEAQGGGQAHGVAVGEAHDEDELDEQEGHGEEPVHVPVGVVEGLPGEGDLVVPVDAESDVEGGRPGVEDADVVVGGDEGDDPGDAHDGAIIASDVGDLEPEEGGSRS